MRSLDRKLLRDLLGMKAQLFAISMVIAAGIAMLVMSVSTLETLVRAQQAYYERYRFAEVFTQLVRAPEPVADRIAEIPGVQRVQTRTVVDVTLDMPGLPEPATGRQISVPENSRPIQNDLHIRRGRYVQPGGRNEALVSEAFAEAHELEVNDSVTAIINGRLTDLRIVGIALSPEYIYEVQPGAIMPDNRRFGVFWMSEQALQAGYDMEGAFNHVALTLGPRASEEEVISRLDRLLEPYGGLGAYGRDEQLSHRFISDEMQQLRVMSIVPPTIFLAVAAFLVNVVLSRTISLQREQIATLKAFGYTKFEIATHYLKLVAVIATIGVALGAAAGGYLGTGLTELYAQFFRFPEFRFRLSWAVVGLSLLLTFAVCVVAVLHAVRAAVNLPPAEAMQPQPPATYRPTLIERLGLQRLFSQPARM
ncbi:MAG: ABC transporter permease, partial [Phycisphaeraceae bacterium]